MDDHPDPQRLRHRVDSDVVVGRADAAGGEDIIVARPQRVQRVDDLVLDVGNDAHFAQANTLHVEPGRDLRDIPVLGAAGEKLVAYHQHGGSPAAFVDRMSVVYGKSLSVRVERGGRSLSNKQTKT